MYVYVKTEASLWTVGFFAPDGRWHTDGDFDSSKEAAERVAYLNGAHSGMLERLALVEQRLDELENREMSPYEAAMILERANER